MIQEIVVYLIILGALGYFGYSVYQIFNPKRISTGKCAGCSSGSCAIKNINQPKG
jgi:hypothetical protein